MRYTILFRPEVDDDIAEAAEWYEQKQPGLGLDFTRTVRDALRDFPSDPLLYRVRDPKRSVRWYYIPRFPYRVIYRVENDCVLVLAILHAARHERRWRQRAK